MQYIYSALKLNITQVIVFKTWHCLMYLILAYKMYNKRGYVKATPNVMTIDVMINLKNCFVFMKTMLNFNIK